MGIYKRSPALQRDLADYWDYRGSDVYRPGIAPLKFRNWLETDKPKTQLGGR